MVIRANNDELHNFSGGMKNNADALTAELEKWKATINELGTVWQGTDSDVYRKNVSNYIGKMESIPESLTTLSNVVEKINKSYIERKEEYSKGIKEVLAKYGK